MQFTFTPDNPGEAATAELLCALVQATIRCAQSAVEKKTLADQCEAQAKELAELRKPKEPPKPVSGLQVDVPAIPTTGTAA